MSSRFPYGFTMLHLIRGLAVIVLWSQAASAAAQFDVLAKYAGHDANALLAIDAGAVLATPLAKREGWSRKLESAFVDRTLYLPPEAQRLLLVSALRPDRHFDSDWEIALMQVSTRPSLPAVARANGGRIEQIRGRDVVSGVGDAYLIPLAGDVVAVYSPANRQLASRWLGDLSSGQTLPPFLKTALGRAGKERPIVLAIDLEDMVDPGEAERRLKASKILDGSPYKLDAAVAQLAKVQGAVVEIEIDTEARATLRVDFSAPLTLSAAIMKRIILNALDENGLKLDELEKFQFNVSGNTVVVDGKLSTGGLRRVLSLLAPPAPALPADDSAAEPQPTSADKQASSSQTYYRTVVALLDDLRGDRSKQDPRGGMDAVWMDKYAQKIDRLPVLNVDPDVLDWGGKTAQTLRVMAGSRRGAGLSAGSQKSALRTGVYVDSYYNVGVSSATATANDANQISTQAGNAATANRVEGWRLIDNATAELRKNMTQRYGVEF